MRLVINVTARDIDQGLPKRQYCPVFRAAKRALRRARWNRKGFWQPGGVRSDGVWNVSFWAPGAANSRGREVRLPDRAIDFVLHFDASHEIGTLRQPNAVSPFCFEVEVEPFTQHERSKR